MTFPKVDGPGPSGFAYDDFEEEKPKTGPKADAVGPPQPQVWGALTPSPTAAPEAEAVAAGVTGGTAPTAKRAGWQAPQTEVHIDFDRDEYASATPEARATQRKSLEARKAVLHGRIMSRTHDLDERWRRATPTTKTDALRAFHDRSRHLEEGARAEVKVLVNRSTEAQRRVEELSVRLEKREAPDDTIVIVAQLSEARTERDAAITRATEVVDGQNLKVERLAIAERILDPSAPAEGSGGSLMDAIEEFAKVSKALEWVTTLFEKMEKASAEREAKQKVIAQKELVKKVIRKRLTERHDAKKDLLKRSQVVEELSRDFAKRELQKVGA